MIQVLYSGWYKLLKWRIYLTSFCTVCLRFFFSSLYELWVLFLSRWVEFLLTTNSLKNVYTCVWNAITQLYSSKKYWFQEGSYCFGNLWNSKLYCILKIEGYFFFVWKTKNMWRLHDDSRNLVPPIEDMPTSFIWNTVPELFLSEYLIYSHGMAIWYLEKKSIGCLVNKLTL